MFLNVDGEDFNISNLFPDRLVLGKSNNSTHSRIANNHNCAQKQLHYGEIIDTNKFPEDNLSLCSSLSSSTRYSLRYQRPSVEHLRSRIGLVSIQRDQASGSFRAERTAGRRPSLGCTRIDIDTGKPHHVSSNDSAIVMKSRRDVDIMEKKSSRRRRHSGLKVEKPDKRGVDDSFIERPHRRVNDDKYCSTGLDVEEFRHETDFENPCRGSHTGSSYCSGGTTSTRENKRAVLQEESASVANHYQIARRKPASKRNSYSKKSRGNSIMRDALIVQQQLQDSHQHQDLSPPSRQSSYSKKTRNSVLSRDSSMVLPQERQESYQQLSPPSRRSSSKKKRNSALSRDSLMVLKQEQQESYQQLSPPSRRSSYSKKAHVNTLMRDVSMIQQEQQQELHQHYQRQSLLPQTNPQSTSRTLYSTNRSDITIRDRRITLQQQPPPPPPQQYNNSTHSAAIVNDNPHIEVAPGVKMEVRGADETLRAIHGGYAIIAICSCCQVKLRCVPDAEVVVCPDCRVLTPLVTDYSKTKNNNISFAQKRGIGLGQKISY